MKKKKLLIANWKLNHTRKSAAEFFSRVIPKLNNGTTSDLAIAPVAPMLDFVASFLVDNKIALAAQNVFYATNGAFTGEYSAAQLAEAKVKYCLVGHSERRQIFGETDSDVAKKTKACLLAGIIPVICVGESAEERYKKKTLSIIERQVKAALDGLESNAPLIFAYEPIWAIGTGQTPTAQEVVEALKQIRQCCKDFDSGLSDRLRILYGGSITAENIREFTGAAEVDGALVGGASLQAESFLSMVQKLQDA